MLFSKISVPFFVAIFASAQAQQQNITYSVISSPPPNMGIAVVVDGTPFPLQANQGILYQGKAPIAQKEYHYAIIESNTVKVPEPFTRSPIQKDTSNEFFNRTLNTHNITSLPQVMTPVPILHRIKSDLHAEGQIPTYHLWGNETAVDYLLKNATEDIDIELNFTYIGLDKIETFEGVKVSLAGRSSRMVDKVSFGIKLKKKSDDTLFGYKNLKLRAMAMDPTYVREKAVHSALKAVGVPASDFSYVRLFINNKPAGLYGVIETFQDPWLASEFKDGDKNYKSGYLYQAILAGMNQQEWQYMSDLSYYDNITTYTLGEYKIKAGPSKDSPQDFSDLQEFTKFIHDASNTTTIDDWQKRMDVDVFLRAMTIENLLGFSDALMTMSNNFNFYKNPEDGRMIYIPYDFDTTLGTGLFEMNLLLTGNYTAFPGLTFRPLSKKFFSYDYFSAPYQNLLVNVTKSLINPTVMNPFFDSVTKMIQPDIEWDMSLPKLTHGAPSPEPGGNMTEIAKILPPGFLTNWTKIPEQYLPPQVFIAKKSAAVLSFYNQSL